jgi:transcriptional regulator with XRE-family HTH domain
VPGLTVGEAIRRIRKRLGKNTTQFAELVASTSASISRYENGKLTPSRSMVLLLQNLAETDEERAPLEEFLRLGAKKTPHTPVRDEENPIAQIRAVSRMAPAVFAAILGCSESDVLRLERGQAQPSKEVAEQLASIATRAGHPELAVAVGAWAVRHVIAPGETLITSARVDNKKIRSSDSAMWHELLEEILSSGDEDAIIAVQHNLVVFGKTVRLGRKSEPKKKSG